jgi:hypothetical protein
MSPSVNHDSGNNNPAFDLVLLLNTVRRLDDIQLEMDFLSPLQQLLAMTYDGMRGLTDHLQQKAALEPEFAVLWRGAEEGSRGA